MKMLEAFEAAECFIGACGDRDRSPFAAQASVFGDELGWVRPVAHVGKDAAAVHTDVDIVTHFKMEMSRIHAAVRAYRANLLATFDGLAVFHAHFVKVTVEGIDKFDGAAGWVPVGMPDEHDISPTGSDIVSERNDAIGARVNRIAKIGVSTAASVPVFTEVLGGAQAQAAGFVVSGAVRLADREVEAIGDVDFGCGERGGRGKSRQKECEQNTRKHRPTDSPVYDPDISVESSHPRLVEPLEGRSGKLKEKRRAFVGRAVWEELIVIKPCLRPLQPSAVCIRRWF